MEAAAFVVQVAFLSSGKIDGEDSSRGGSVSPVAEVAAVVEAVARQRCGRLRQSESHYAPPEPPSMKLMTKQTLNMAML